MVKFTDTADSRNLENVCPRLDVSGQIRLGIWCWVVEADLCGTGENGLCLVGSVLLACKP